MTKEAHAHEIVIIKRHGGHEEAHHGGVWKIAFADFMTAMMAFFLVMWLVSANDKTKAVIAKYFNPVELVDSTPQPPGLNDSKKGDPSIQRETKKPSPDGGVKDAKSQGKSEATTPAADKPIAEAAASADASHDEAELTRDPYAVLAEIANKANKEAPEKTKEPRDEDAQRGVGSQGQKGGEAFRDPFQPLQAGSSEAASAARADIAAQTAGSTPAVPPPPAPPPSATPAPPAAPAAMAPAAPAPAAAPAPPEEAALPAPVSGDADAAAGAAPDKPLSPAALRAKIAALGSGSGGAAGPGPKLDVKQTSEGLLISLTDSADFAMFPTSSARPVPKMLALVEKIGQLLKTQKGSVTVRGFTDSRPFKSDTYDNWRLSSARAQIAHYMLVRGGLSDSRIDHVEGYADRRPRNPKNPDAAENRRIEILLRDPTP